MMRPRDELIDFVLHELSPGRHRAVADRIARDPEVAAERDELEETMSVIRAAAAEGWPAARRARLRPRLLRPAIAAAAILLVTAGLFLIDRSGPRAVYEPDGAYGYLLPEETDSKGRVREPSTTTEYRLRRGSVTISALGSDREYVLCEGQAFPVESEVKTQAETGAQIDLPGGGILFMAPISTVRVRRHQAGGPALRLMDGVACTVAGGVPLHLAVHDTDLLLLQESGAACLRESPAEAVALRGELQLQLADGKRFRVKQGERLPAACATAPRTQAVGADYLDLQWYRDLVYRSYRADEVAWESAGRSQPLRPDERTLVFMRAVPVEDGTLEVAFGAAPRRFDVSAGIPFQLRLNLRDLGPGPRLTVTPAAAIKAARLFEAVPR